MSSISAARCDGKARIPATACAIASSTLSTHSTAAAASPSSAAGALPAAHGSLRPPGGRSLLRCACSEVTTRCTAAGESSSPRTLASTSTVSPSVSQSLADCSASRADVCRLSGRRSGASFLSSGNCGQSCSRPEGSPSVAFASAFLAAGFLSEPAFCLPPPDFAPGLDEPPPSAVSSVSLPSSSAWEAAPLAFPPLPFTLTTCGTSPRLCARPATKLGVSAAHCSKLSSSAASASRRATRLTAVSVSCVRTSSREKLLSSVRTQLTA
mmetsp:Transcript_33741/g.84063  ORF Transcript_33741/g.84063 Transcript_33741/m.84063 type:complete len:268 (+) Transcript_33741:1604-2407(+)